MTTEQAIKKELELRERGSCEICRGKGYVEVHQPGYTHFKTDSECPPYHFQRVPCTCSPQNRVASALLRAYADGIEWAIDTPGIGWREWQSERVRIRAEADKLEQGCTGGCFT
jgi:hypothetical protein